MSTSPHKGQPWLKWTIILITAAVLLLIAGAFPGMDAPGVYRSGLLLLLGVLIAALCLFAIVWPRKKNIPLLLLHAGGLLILVGAFLDHFQEKKLSCYIPVGESLFAEIFDEKERVPVPLGFEFGVTDFQITYYPPTYSLHDYQKRKILETGSEQNGEIVFPKNKIKVPADQFKQMDGAPHPWLPVDDHKVVVQNRPNVKFYDAAFRIKDGEKIIPSQLAVNHPVSHKGWRFYLLSHHLQGNQEFVYLTARKAPGRNWVTLGIYILMTGAFLFAFVPRKQRKEAA